MFVAIYTRSRIIADYAYDETKARVAYLLTSIKWHFYLRCDTSHINDILRKSVFVSRFTACDATRFVAA